MRKSGQNFRCFLENYFLLNLQFIIFIFEGNMAINLIRFLKPVRRLFSIYI